MKRVLRHLNRIEVTINVECTGADIAASTVNHPASIKKQNRISDEKLLILNDIVDMTVAYIESHGFPIIYTRQSKKSYTVYIRFQPMTTDNKKSTPVEIIFRIADHSSLRTKDEDSQLSRDVRIRSFLIGDEEYSNFEAFISKIDYICDRLEVGDTSALYR